MSFQVIIPARYASSRLPGKVLADIAGKPMLQHVFDNAARSGASRVIVATDDQRVARAAAGFGAPVRLTGTQHRSGTERIAEVIAAEPIEAHEVVVNVQADEPLMPPELIAQVARDLCVHPGCEVATLCEPIATAAVLADPNAVKVVRDHAGFALYFSRATIPCYQSDLGQSPVLRSPRALHFRHIGIYAYRAGYVGRYVALPPSSLELAESLEQLRVLNAGDRIHVATADLDPGPGVDTAADLARARALAAQLSC